MVGEVRFKVTVPLPPFHIVATADDTLFVTLTVEFWEVATEVVTEALKLRATVVPALA